LTETTTASPEPTDAVAATATEDTPATEPTVVAEPAGPHDAAPDGTAPGQNTAERPDPQDEPKLSASDADGYADPGDDADSREEADSRADAHPGEDVDPRDDVDPREDDGAWDEAGSPAVSPSAAIPIAAGPPPEPVRATFADLGLSEDVLRAIEELGYRHPTPIQEQAVPYVLMGRDVLGIAQTGTGKTAGFTLPMLDILTGRRARARMPRSLILEPTRELALQVAENFVQYGKYLKLTHALIIGGESMSDQKEVLNRGVDVLIATPGRLLDMFDRGTVLMSDTSILVIDEADRMLDMGFIPDVERIVSLLPSNRQTLFFSATMGPEIKRLADAFLRNPKEVTVSRAATVATTITEGLALVAEHDKREALRRLIRSQNVQNALIFCNRKVDVDILYKSLTKHLFSAGALHGDLSQTIRFQTLEKFKSGDLRLLVCSDVAARGLDIGGLSHVFNFDVPIHAEDYVHRIGRTGRAGLAGNALTIAAPDDRFAVEQIEKLIGHAIPPVIVEGLDPIDWAEGGGRKRRGRSRVDTKRAPAKSAPAAKREREKDAPRKAAEPRTRTPRVRSDAPDARTSEGRAPDGRAPDGRAPEGRSPEERAPVARSRGRNETRRDGTRRDETQRDETRRDETRRDEGAATESRRDEPRRDEFRRDEPRRDDGRRERYRRDDDLGPSVVGFGDDVPAFMLVRRRRPQAQTQEISETEA
jgi:superfamily II DNA/RNA helicase